MADLRTALQRLKRCAAVEDPAVHPSTTAADSGAGSSGLLTNAAACAEREDWLVRAMAISASNLQELRTTLEIVREPSTRLSFFLPICYADHLSLADLAARRSSVL